MSGWPQLRRKFNVDVELQAPKVPYKETIKGRAEAQGKYKRQSGGRGQYGDCWLKIEPMQRWRRRELGAVNVELSADMDAYPAVFFEDPAGTLLEIVARKPTQ